MSVRNKIVIPAILLTIILFQTGGYHLVFKIWQLKIQKEMKWNILRGVPNDHLVLLKVPLTVQQSPGSDFTFIHANEFRYKDEMYDVVRKEMHHDTAWFYCIRDGKETFVLRELNAAVRDHLEQNPNANKQSQRFLAIVELKYLITRVTDVPRSPSMVSYRRVNDAVFKPDLFTDIAPPPKS